MERLEGATALAECDAADHATFERDIRTRDEPIVLRGQVRQWPAVAAANQGLEALARYIAGFDGGAPAEVLIGAPEIRGRFFYRDDMRGFNFRREAVPLAQLLQQLLRLAHVAAPPALYAGAAATERHLPGWSEANPLDLPTDDATPRIWIGNATRISTHFDASPNLACVAAGERRFLVFPPDQIDNLYVGPIDVTVAGQPTSMVDPLNPDIDRCPRFAEAMRHARVAVLGPGDAIYMPALWWHHVEAFGPLNVLVNYWWDRAIVEPPLPALVHAMLALRDLSPYERSAWRRWFDHYVFDDAAPHAADHLPEHARSVLGEDSDARSARMRAYLRNALRVH